MQTAVACSMQATQSGTFGKFRGETFTEPRKALSTTASLVRPASIGLTSEFTLAQRFARYGLTALAIVAMSALFATQIATTLR